MKQLLEELVYDSKFWVSEGEVASYIPKLANTDPKLIGVGVYTIDNEYYEAGDSNTSFSIQSIVKVFSLICALKESTLERLLMKVDVEPSGDKYNSLIKLETMKKHKPLNPFINAGAIAIVGQIKGNSSGERYQKVLDLIRKLTDNDKISYNREVFESERKTGDTNKAIAYFLKGAGIIDGNIDDILDTYFKLCSIEVTVKDMAKASAVIANNGIVPWSDESVISREDIKIVRAIMLTSGLYDGSGNFAVKVGIPAKSGVGGGIIGAVPSKMGIATFGPSLNDKGNSVAGLRIFENLSKDYDLSLL
jgi:glutaminase